MNITIYRGTHEIGGTLIEVQTGTSRILLDAGYPLFLKGKPIDDHIASLSREELLSLGVLPGIRGLYQWDTPSFDAVIISHAHIDHYGLIKYLHERIPVYMSAGTKTLIAVSQLFKICAPFKLNPRIFQMYQPFSIGDIEVKPYLMDHSAFDAAAFEISAQGKTIIYTGDFRGHGRKAVCLERFIADATRNADVLLTEGTMLGRQDETILTETELENKAVDILNECRSPGLFQSSSQNIDRLVTFYRAAIRSKRVFVIDIYTANVLYELRQLGNHLPYPSNEYPDIKVFYPYRLTQKVFNEIGDEYAKRFSGYHISKKDLHSKQNKILMSARPSMWKDIELCEFQNGCFMYSLWQGYRDSKYQQDFEQYLDGIGFNFIALHTSGHAAVSDIENMINKLNPREIVPIHTMAPGAFKKISEKVSLREDGVPFEI
jgi:ribonuclease J